MGAIATVARKLHAEGNSIEKILDAIEAMEDGAKPARRGKDGSPRVELERVLDTTHAQAVVDYRQRIRKPLTGYAAKLLADEFGKCGDPNFAADTMISKGWQGFDADWVNRNEQHRNLTRDDGRGSGNRSRHASLMQAFGFEADPDQH